MQQSDPRQRPKYRAFYFLYDRAWSLAMPVLKKNSRIAEGYSQRALKTGIPRRCDLWIQAASGGEAYLAWTLLKHVHPAQPIRVLLTSGTRQGMEVLEQAARDNTLDSGKMSLSMMFFPFDKPSIMKSAVRRIQPRLVVLLEAELWPGLLLALKQENRHTWVINGRLTAKSLARYRMLPGLWPYVRPERVLAISPEDADRFRSLFGEVGVDVMRNIKFDRFSSANESPPGSTRLTEWIDPSSPFVVLGSIREQEEADVLRMVVEILARQPEAIIGLFPRHLHRIERWRRLLSGRNISWVLRSGLNQPVSGGRVILWDVFGELGSAYERANAAFVGGSLARLGGQNFLEPLFAGVIPVIGPSWENFAWIGSDIVSGQLVKVAADWKEAASRLVGGLAPSEGRSDIRMKARQFLRDRQGGASMAAGMIRDALLKT